MSKPEKQKSDGVAVLVDGITARRVQRIGVNTDIPREQARELANSGVVEYIEDSPAVTISIDTNMVGSVDLMALLSDSVIDYNIADETDGARGGPLRTYIKAASSNAFTITEADLLNGYCSLLVTCNEDGDYAKRTMWCNHCAVTNVTLNYDVGGNASENYSLKADNKTWFFNSAAAVRCYKPIFSQIGYNANGIAFSGLASAIPDGSSVMAIAYNNNILRRRTVGGTTGNATFSAVASGAFTATSVAFSTPWVSTVDTSKDRVWVIYHSTATMVTGDLWEATSDYYRPGWELESSAGAVGALRRGHIKAYLWNTQTTGKDTYTLAGKALRLQTVSIEVALGDEELQELGTSGFYAISKQTPVPITVTISANDSDLQYYAALTSRNYQTAAYKQISVEDFNGYNSIRVEVYKDKAQTTLLETVTINNMYVQAENFDVGVGENAKNEITFTCDNISRVGSGSNITGGPNYA